MLSVCPVTVPSAASRSWLVHHFGLNVIWIEAIWYNLKCLSKQASIRGNDLKYLLDSWWAVDVVRKKLFQDIILSFGDVVAGGDLLHLQTKTEQLITVYGAHWLMEDSSCSPLPRYDHLQVQVRTSRGPRLILDTSHHVTTSNQPGLSTMFTIQPPCDDDHSFHPVHTPDPGQGSIYLCR